MAVKRSFDKICVIGAGNIGSAMIRGLAKSNVMVTAYNRSPGRLAQFCDYLNITCTTSLADALSQADIVLVCTETEAVIPIVKKVAGCCRDSLPVVGSCSAAVTIDELKCALSEATDTPAVFRLLPNIAATVGCSANLLCGIGLKDDEKEQLKELFSSTGTTVDVPEKLFPAAMALSSCGIAYALRYVRANMLAGVQMGLTPEVSRELASAVLAGTAKLLEVDSAHPEALVDRVTTPGGVTIRGLNTMEEGGFSSSIVSGLLATLKK